MKDMSEEMMSDMEKCEKRMKRIMATPEEVMLYEYSPNEARDNDHPAIPRKPHKMMKDD